MTKLAELRSLISLARRLGQEPSAALLEQVSRLEREEQQRQEREAKIKQGIAEDLNRMFSAEPVSSEPAQPEPMALTETTTEPLLETKPSNVDAVRDYIARNIKESIVAPDPVLATPQKDLEREIKYLREWVSRIAATGPGGGEVNLRYLDDINRSTIQDGYFLRYDASTKKFVFDQVASGTVIYGTTSTTTSYTVQTGDYYIGVSSNAQVTINIPISAASGRSIIIKDESGRCSVNPITISGTIDNDTSGAILAIDNGALHLIYRQGWRIV